MDSKSSVNNLYVLFTRVMHVASSEALRIVEQSMRRLRNAHFATTGFFIRCPFHTNDTNPSLGVNTSKSGVPIGFYYCFGCGTKGHWNTLAEKLGFPKIAKADFKNTETSVYDFDEIRQNLLGSKSPVDRMIQSLGANFNMEWPVEESWRTIKGSLLHEIGANITYDERNQDRAILLPVNVMGETVGMIKGTNRAMEKSYTMNKGVWSKKYGLFPYDYVDQQGVDSVAIVEGARDALRLIKFGIPALAILGSQSWSETKLNLILSLGLRKVVLALDGDRAGVQCTNMIYHSIKSLVPTSVLKLKSHSDMTGTKIDPGNMGRHLIEELRDKMRVT